MGLAHGREGEPIFHRAEAKVHMEKYNLIYVRLKLQGSPKEYY